MTKKKKLIRSLSTNFLFGKNIFQSNKNFVKFKEKNQLSQNDPLVVQAAKTVFFNTCFDKNNLKTLIAWFLEQYGEKVTIDLVETLKEVGFHQATSAGVSLGLDDLQIPPQKATLLSKASTKMLNVKNEIERGNLTSVEKSQRLIDTWNQTSETLRQTAVHNFRITNPVNPVYMMAFSGARGNISQVRQLVAMRGLMADPQGAILEFPIQSNFREGLTVTEYLISCYGARKGLVDTALRTATSGYLTRRLVDAVQHVVVHVTDCHTKKGIVLKDKNLEQRLIGRVLLDDIQLNSSTILKKNTLVSQRLAKKIVEKHKEIHVRSPLTCQTEKSVCQFCYGLDLAQGKLVSIGEAVGIIAAQSIGEPGTQLTMRTFHTGGVGVFSDQALKSFLAPFEGKIQFVAPLPGLFVRTPHGNIVYLVKHKNNSENKPILRLIPKSKNGEENSSVYEISEAEVPSGSILWVKEGEFVKTGQLLIQASRIQTAAQEMPESSHPVRSSISGEIFFQSMSIRVIEEEKRAFQKTKKKKHSTLLPLQINQKEISPTFPTLVELGNFWVFSSFIQKEASFAKSFFVKGDLLSPSTPIHQYNLYLPAKGQLKSIQFSPALAYNWLNFLFSKIYYSNSFYFLFDQTEKTQPNIISYTKNSKQTLLHWYPLITNRNLGYCSIFSDEVLVNSIKGQDITDLSTFCFSQPEKINYIWTSDLLFNLKAFPTTNEFFSLKRESHKIQAGCFLFTKGNEFFSKQGLFQVEKPFQVSNYQIHRLNQNFVKNPLQNYTHSSLNRPLQLRQTPSKLTTEQLFSRTIFLRKVFKIANKVLLSFSTIKLIQKEKVWFYIPEHRLPKGLTSQSSHIILEPSKKFENIRFSNSSVSAHSINKDNLFIFKSHKKLKRKTIFYSPQDLINLKKEFQLNDLILENFTPNFTKKSTFEINTNFCFYKKDQFLSSTTLNFFIKTKQQPFSLLAFQRNFQKILPENKIVKQNWLLKKKLVVPRSIKSPLFTKQKKTLFNSSNNLLCNFQITTPKSSDWFFNSQILKVEILFNSLTNFEKIESLEQQFLFSNSQNSSLIFVPGFSFFLYRNFTLKNPFHFDLETFKNNYILPEYRLCPAFLKAKKLGEFHGVQEKQEANFVSLVEKQDKVSFGFPSEIDQKLMFNSKVGMQVRWGQEIISGFAIPHSGQILKITNKSITLRKGIPFLASMRGLIHISHNDFVQKNDLLITLRSRRLQTEDIVQGIPKIEQLFEARETQGGEIIQNNMHTLLTTFFNRARQIKPVDEAVQLSLTYIQKFLVENILQAYSTQGVHIAEKHVEVVVRQMTARVRITHGGESGLLPGELIQLRLIENVNKKLQKLGHRPAEYEPIILGITKSVLQSESFLLAASFQQVSKVLVRSALAKKTDFLRGLHENVLVGQAIPAGTGIINVTKFLET